MRQVEINENERRSDCLGEEKVGDVGAAEDASAYGHLHVHVVGWQRSDRQRLIQVIIIIVTHRLVWINNH